MFGDVTSLLLEDAEGVGGLARQHDGAGNHGKDADNSGHARKSKTEGDS